MAASSIAFILTATGGWQVALGNARSGALDGRRRALCQLTHELWARGGGETTVPATSAVGYWRGSGQPTLPSLAGQAAISWNVCVLSTEQGADGRITGAETGQAVGSFHVIVLSALNEWAVSSLS